MLGNPFTNIGVLDLYDVRTNCLKPTLLSSTNTAVLGHESGFAPDGNTFYASSTGGQTLAAIDVKDPRNPKRIFLQSGVNYHGLRLSPDGRTMYVANIGNPSGVRLSSGGLRILDVSEIQDRKPNPKVKVVADLDWPEGSLRRWPSRSPRRAGTTSSRSTSSPTSAWTAARRRPRRRSGAARIIDIEDPANPKVISHLRLAVHQPGARAGDQQLDPGALIPVQGYAGHYCSLPQDQEPQDRRLLDDPVRPASLRHPGPAEPARGRLLQRARPSRAPNSLNPTALGAFAMSAPAWDAARRAVWYTDANKGFFVVALTNGVGRLLLKRKPR